MGDTGQIDWNPLNSTLGQAVQGNVGKAWEDIKQAADPRQSTLARLVSGDFDTVGQHLQGGATNLLRKGPEFTLGLMAPTAIRGNWEAQEAAKRRDADLAGIAAQESAAQREAARKREQDELLQGQKKNQDYLTGQAQQQASLDEMDAFTKARNAARKAKGQSLFGAWG